MAIRTSFGLDHVRRKRRLNRPEQDMQLQLVRALNLALLPGTAFFHVPNGGQRSKVEAAIFRGMGVMPGVPDLLFIRAQRVFGIELKDEGEDLSPSQREAHVTLRAAGMRIEVARSIGEAFEHLRDMGIPLRIKSESDGFSRAAVNSVLRDDSRRRKAA